MDSLGQIIRISFFRLFFSISVGFIGILFLFIIYYSKLINVNILVNSLEDFKLLVGLVGNGFLFIFFILSVLFFIGESLIFLGELLINGVFDFDLLANGLKGKDDKLEKVTPTSNEYITYKNLINFFKKTPKFSTLQEISELHFVISRFFSGIMFIGLVGMFYFILLLVFKELEGFFLICFCFCIIILVLILFILEIYKISKLLKIFTLLSILALIISLVLESCIEYIPLIFSITLFLLGLYVSITYRAFANSIIKYGAFENLII